MKIALLVALCCLLSVQVEATSSDPYDDAVKALTPSGCEWDLVDYVDTISYDALPAKLKFSADLVCKDGKDQVCKYDGEIDAPKHIKHVRIVCNGSLGTSEKSDVNL